jgi:glycosyltransferase involved in cell wall biosynthesis
MVKIAVYTIAKNEAKHVERWYESAKDADYLLICDTGSSDDTVEIARSLGITVVETKVDPWRFDTARNFALDALPDDIDYCISMDMDEVISPNFREELEKSLAQGITLPTPTFIYNEDMKFLAQRIHARKGYVWRWAIHEAICNIDGLQVTGSTDIVMEHHPDEEKSRGGYLPLLEFWAEQEPEDARYSYYYARELYYYSRYIEAKAEFIRYLNLAGAWWNVERARACRFIAEMSSGLECRLWLQQAVHELPDYREAWVELSQWHYDNENWADGYSTALEAIKIEDGTNSLAYQREAFAWGERAYDLASICAHRMGNNKEALYYGKIASNMAPNNERLQNNLQYFV